MRNMLGSEPAMILVGGGTALVQAIMQVLIVFDVPITPPQQAAVTALVGVILGLLTRLNVTPTASLPPGVAGQIADEKAVRAAEKSEANK